MSTGNGSLGPSGTVSQTAPLQETGTVSQPCPSPTVNGEAPKGSTPGPSGQPHAFPPNHQARRQGPGFTPSGPSCGSLPPPQGGYHHVATAAQQPGTGFPGTFPVGGSVVAAPNSSIQYPSYGAGSPFSGPFCGYLPFPQGGYSQSDLATALQQKFNDGFAQSQATIAQLQATIAQLQATTAQLQADLANTSKDRDIAKANWGHVGKAFSEEQKKSAAALSLAAPFKFPSLTGLPALATTVISAAREFVQFKPVVDSLRDVRVSVNHAVKNEEQCVFLLRDGKPLNCVTSWSLEQCALHARTHLKSIEEWITSHSKDVLYWAVARLFGNQDAKDCTDVCAVFVGELRSVCSFLINCVYSPLNCAIRYRDLVRLDSNDNNQRGVVCDLLRTAMSMCSYLQSLSVLVQLAVEVHVGTAADWIVEAMIGLVCARTNASFFAALADDADAFDQFRNLTYEQYELCKSGLKFETSGTELVASVGECVTKMLKSEHKIMDPVFSNMCGKLSNVEIDLHCVVDACFTLVSGLPFDRACMAAGSNCRLPPGDSTGVSMFDLVQLNTVNTRSMQAYVCREAGPDEKRKFSAYLGLKSDGSAGWGSILVTDRISKFDCSSAAARHAERRTGRAREPGRGSGRGFRRTGSDNDRMYNRNYPPLGDEKVRKDQLQPCQNQPRVYVPSHVFRSVCIVAKYVADRGLGTMAGVTGLIKSVSGSIATGRMNRCNRPPEKSANATREADAQQKGSNEESRRRCMSEPRNLERDANAKAAAKAAESAETAKNAIADAQRAAARRVKEAAKADAARRREEEAAKEEAARRREEEAAKKAVKNADNAADEAVRKRELAEAELIASVAATNAKEVAEADLKNVQDSNRLAVTTLETTTARLFDVATQSEDPAVKEAVRTFVAAESAVEKSKQDAKNAEAVESRLREEDQVAAASADVKAAVDAVENATQDCNEKQALCLDLEKEKRPQEEQDVANAERDVALKALEVAQAKANTAKIRLEGAQKALTDADAEVGRTKVAVDLAVEAWNAAKEAVIKSMSVVAATAEKEVVTAFTDAKKAAETAKKALTVATKCRNKAAKVAFEKAVKAKEAGLEAEEAVARAKRAKERAAEMVVEVAKVVVDPAICSDVTVPTPNNVDAGSGGNPGAGSGGNPGAGSGRKGRNRDVHI
jgi:hypothetical protein